MILEEDCKLVASYTGEGWTLEVHTNYGECIAYLTWPKSWPDEISDEKLKEFGFEIQ